MEPRGYPPADDMIQWLQPCRSTHDFCKNCSAFCASVDKWSMACNTPANSSRSLYRWQKGLGPLQMSCECMGMRLLLIMFDLMVGLCLAKIAWSYRGRNGLPWEHGRKTCISLWTKYSCVLAELAPAGKLSSFFSPLSVTHLTPLRVQHRPSSWAAPE